MKQFLAVGQIINTHGLNGELKVYPLTDDMKRFRKLNKVFIDGIEKNIVWCKLQSDTVILKIEGVETLEDAHKLRNKYLEINRDDAIKLPENTYFVADLIGCSVFDTSENFLGNIYDVIKTGSNDVYWIKEGKELLIPALKDIVQMVDIENKKIVIKPVELWQ